MEFDEYMKLLNFTPAWLSPNHALVNEELMTKCREKGMKVVPWTVDNPEDIRRMIDLKVDAIISNYPDRVLLQTRGY
jgi:glycerophosphoryl diester phosphodiesterase